MKELLKLTRLVLESQFNGKEIKVSDEIKKKYGEKKACFVTLTKNGDLRGCIGSLEAHQALYLDVIDNAINSGFNDYRFEPLEKDELEDVKIEISVLSIPKKLGLGKNVFEKIDNKTGIILKNENGSATFLPQVWEQIPDKKIFLEELSRKAGLDKDAWEDSEIWFYRIESVEE